MPLNKETKPKPKEKQKATQLHKQGHVKFYIYNIYAGYILAATPHKAPTIRPPASHHENYPS